MEELVKIEDRIISSELVKTVNARELHEFLGVKTKYSQWASKRIEELQLIEEYDFIIIPNFGKNSAGRPSKDYFLTLDSAKHFAMLEKNERGHEVRCYFIEVEKEARLQHAKIMEDPLMKLCHKHALMRMEQERQLQMIIDNQKKIQELDASVRDEEEYYKARAFCKIANLNLTEKELKQFGKQAAWMSRQMDYKIEQQSCSNWGSVNKYHIDVLRELEKQWK